jgi:hypothetical protein
MHWEPSPFNPVLKASPADKRIANPKLTVDQKEKIAGAVDRNNSDVDLSEFRGKTIITYSWGNQQGTELLGEAVYNGTLACFLKRFFPRDVQSAWCHHEEKLNLNLSTVRIEKPESGNFILGQTHFIKSVEDIHEALVNAVPGIKFGLAFCEASGKCLIRWSGTDESMV